MKAANMLRVATADMVGAVEFACSEVETAVGLPVRPELQEIENGCLIVEMRLGDAHIHTPPPSRLALAVGKAISNIEVLSAWNAPSSLRAFPRRTDFVFTPPDDSMASVAHRALRDALPTAEWEPKAMSWHLAVPCTRSPRPTVIGSSRRRGYSMRFTSLEVAAFRRGLASWLSIEPNPALRAIR
jgi:hypothetical protein